MLCTALECQMACQQNPVCILFQYQRFTGNCQLKNSVNGLRTGNTSMLIGPAECDFIKSM